jgi:hypothetical protein
LRVANPPGLADTGDEVTDNGDEVTDASLPPFS